MNYERLQAVKDNLEDYYKDSAEARVLLQNALDEVNGELETVPDTTRKHVQLKIEQAEIVERIKEWEVHHSDMKKEAWRSHYNLVLKESQASIREVESQLEDKYFKEMNEIINRLVEIKGQYNSAIEESISDLRDDLIEFDQYRPKGESFSFVPPLMNPVNFNRLYENQFKTLEDNQ